MTTLTTLIKRFEFTEDVRKTLTLGTGTRLNPVNHRLELAATDGLYSMDPDLNVVTWVTTPKAVKAWTGFEVVDVITLDADNVALNSVAYRLTDGTNQFYWDGSDWTVSTTLWNTEAEVADNISAFPATARALGIVVNLVTTDERYTPGVELIKVLYEAQIDFQKDLIFRSLLPALKGIEAISEMVLVWVATGDTQTLSDPLTQTPYNFTGVIDAVYNNDDDPDHMEDLLLSYDSGTRLLTLDESIAANKKMWVRFKYKPEAAVTTGRSYTEIGKVPVLVVSDITLVDSADPMGAYDEVVNKRTGQGTRVANPYTADIEFTLRVLTDKAGDQSTLADAVMKFFRNTPLLKSVGMDEPYRLWLLDEYQGEGVTTQEEVKAGRLRARIMRALFFDKPASAVTRASRVVLGGTLNVIVS